jgi:hypothetical protein
MIQDDPAMGWRDRYDARGTEEIVGDPALHPAAVNVLKPEDSEGA